MRLIADHGVYVKYTSLAQTEQLTNRTNEGTHFPILHTRTPCRVLCYYGDNPHNSNNKYIMVTMCAHLHENTIIRILWGEVQHFSWQTNERPHMQVWRGEKKSKEEKLKELCNDMNCTTIIYLLYKYMPIHVVSYVSSFNSRLGAATDPPPDPWLLKRC